MQLEILVTVIFLSVLHGLIPSHWAPLMIMKKQYKWSVTYTTKWALLINMAHIMSTVLIGVIVAYFGDILKVVTNAYVIKIISSGVLGILGGYFIYRHYYHHHFHIHLEENMLQQKDIRTQMRLLILGMLFSPCMEIRGMFFVGGMLSWQDVFVMMLIYSMISIFSSIFWILFFDVLSSKINFHQLEHNSGLLSGASLLLSAVLVYFL